MSISPNPVTSHGSEQQVEVSVVIPCLNESPSLDSCVRAARQAIRDANLVGEVIVADNGSTDGSQRIACNAGARLCNVNDKGYGNALMGGIDAAHGKFVVMGDADNTYDFSDIPKFVAVLRGGADLVMGNRFAGKIEQGAMPFLHRYLGNPVLSFIGRLFFRSPVRDFHCGLRAFRKDSYERMNLNCTGMEFASEMVVKASLLEMKIGEVPTTLRPGPPGRSPHLRTWRDGWRHMRFLLLYSPRWLFLFPGALLMLVGLVAIAILLPGPLRFGGSVLDVHTMLYAACSVLVGFQVIAFAVFSRIFAMTEGLLPPNRALQRLFRYITLETGLAFGSALALAGLGTSIAAVVHWRNAGFGPLHYERMMRMVIPSALLLTLGIQIVFSSFFLSMLGLRRRAHR